MASSSPDSATPADSTTPTPTTGRRWQAGALTYTTGGLALLFVWLLWGDFGYYLKDRSVRPTLQLLLKQFQLSDMYVGLLLVSLPQAFAIGLAPVISYHSDRFRSRWGRRIPFLFVPTPIAFGAMIGLAFSPAIGRVLHQALSGWDVQVNTCVVISFAFFWTIFELCAIICNSAFFGLINDVVPHVIISRFFAMFRICSLAAGVFFNLYLFGQAETHSVAIFLGIGALYLVSFSLMCFKVKEGPYPPPPPKLPGPAGGPVAAVRSYFRDCFHHAHYRWIFLAFTFAWMASTPFDAFYIYYAQSVQMDMATLGKYAAAQLFVSLLQAYPVGWLADRFHPLRMMILVMGLYVVVSLLAFFLVRDAASYGFFFVAFGSLTGFFLTGTLSVGPMLFPKMKFATFDSARIACYSVGIMIAGPACGSLLDFSGKQYRFVYLWACVFGLLALGATLMVYRGFVRHGGMKHYVAPE